ncbi:MAG: YbhB/YbcL family Raf kinase inhibitor-like protein [SAR86 cluster bacterium]|uniref:YbhB/YbcL family Raf kinase inhibitor-like protein n=1 Tax=SAR86 cluster bacterium TaxID=2030880 RepID=A0A2A5B2N1_9GAMM|nr:MAG: YbhB/YbcL family Raf kinase inhibitor-like protein [SAR86 cluster bacterium]
MNSLIKIENARWIFGTLGALLLSVQVHAADAPETISVTSSAFDHHGTIPLEYTAYGDNKSIDLSWSNLPAGTVQLALICDDPIVEMPQPFVHWVAYNIPTDASGLPQSLARDAEVSGIADLEGMINGLNGIRQAGYFGPRPPVDGKLHAYHFKLYALDANLALEAGLNKEQLLEAIDGHVLATGLLMGHYQRTDQ